MTQQMSVAHKRMTRHGEGTNKYEMAIWWSKGDRAYLAAVPELPGCMANGETAEAALAQARLAIAAWIEVARAEGRVVPESSGGRVRHA